MHFLLNVLKQSLYSVLGAVAGVIVWVAVALLMPPLEFSYLFGLVQQEIE